MLPSPSTSTSTSLLSVFSSAFRRRRLPFFLLPAPSNFPVPCSLFPSRGRGSEWRRSKKKKRRRKYEKMKMKRSRNVAVVDDDHLFLLFPGTRLLHPPPLPFRQRGEGAKKTRRVGLEPTLLSEFDSQ